MKTIFIIGGHYTPAKAVIDELVKQGSWKIFYLGSPRSFEGDRAPSYEYLELQDNSKVTFLSLMTGRLQRRWTRHTAVSLAKIPVGFIQSLYWLAKYRPDAVLSFGGFLALPVAIAAKIFGVKVVTHEQTTVFGLANEMIQLFADAVLVSFTSTLPVEKGKWKFVGNPVRADIFRVNDTTELAALRSLKKKLGLPVIYVTGGKQGSHVINSAVLRNLDKMLDQAVIIVQTGANEEFGDYQGFLRARSELSVSQRPNLLVKKFVMSAEIGSVLDLADLVVSRAGANAVFDLAAAAKPAILVPIPWSAGGEQEKNARELASCGGAVILDEADLERKLLSTVKSMILKLSELKSRAKGARSLVVNDSAVKIVREINRLL